MKMHVVNLVETVSTGRQASVRRKDSQFRPRYKKNINDSESPAIKFIEQESRLQMWSGPFTAIACNEGRGIDRLETSRKLIGAVVRYFSGAGHDAFKVAEAVKKLMASPVIVDEPVWRRRRLRMLGIGEFEINSAILK